MRIFNVMLFIALLLIPVLTLAKGPANVTNGLHNLSGTGVDPYWLATPGSSLYVTDEDEVCVFCHTPHGGTLDAPLWNKNGPAPASGWTHYNSATMSIDPGLSVSRAPNEESLVCLSCHDGSISVNHVINLPNDRDGATIKSLGFGEEDVRIYNDIYTGGPGKRIGASPGNGGGTGQLQDDHPISFSYNQVLASDDYLVTGSKYNTLKSVSIAEGAGVAFFGGSNNVECSSCHDPHVDYISNPAYSPFLIMPNSGSALCLACHTK
jgi:hypothetical protein